MPPHALATPLVTAVSAELIVGGPFTSWVG